MAETRVVVLDPSERQAVLRLQKMREEREARFQDLLRRYCEAVWERVSERTHLSVTAEGNIKIGI